MPQDPKRPPVNGMDPAEYRRVQAAKAQRRKKRRQQRMMVLGAFALAVIILIVCIVLVIRSIFKKDDGSTTTTSGSIPTSEVAGGGDGLSWPTAANKAAWNLWLINEYHPVVADFERPDMERIVVNGVEYWFDSRMWPSLEQMVADCNAIEGHSLVFYAGFRSYEKQEEKFNNYLGAYLQQGQSQEDATASAKKHTEAAGTADNHTGLAVEFMTASDSEPGDSFATTPEYTWLLQNASNYGFILRYPANKEAITGVPYKPYHFRYVGVEDAAVITGAGICLEEYLADIPTSGDAGGESTTSLPEDGTTSGTSK